MSPRAFSKIVEEVYKDSNKLILATVTCAFCMLLIIRVFLANCHCFGQIGLTAIDPLQDYL